MENVCYILVRSSTYASKVAKLLSFGGMRTRAVKSPRGLSTGGCGHAVAVKGGDSGEIAKRICDAGLPEFRIYVSS